MGDIVGVSSDIVRDMIAKNEATNELNKLTTLELIDELSWAEEDIEIVERKTEVFEQIDVGELPDI